MKIDLDNTKQLSAGTVDLGYSVKYEHKILKKSNKATELQVLNFKKSAVQFLAVIYKHLSEKRVH